MKKALLTIIVIYNLLWAGLLNSQGGFRKKIFLPNVYDGVCKDIFQTKAGGYIAIGSVTDSIQGGYRLSVAGLDTIGNLLWKKTYGHKNLNYFDNDMHFRGPLLSDSAGFYYAACITDSLFGRTYSALLRFDLNGDTLWQRIYKDPDPLEDVMVQGMCRGADGGLLLTGIFQHWGTSSGGGTRCLLLKTDLQGNELWRKKISKTVPNVHDGNSIVQDSVSKKIVICGYQYIGNSTSWTDFGSVIILDSLGNKIKQTTYNNSGGAGFTGLIQTLDNNFVVCGSMNQNNDLGNLTRYKGLLVKFDINGSKIWSKEYDIASPMNWNYLLRELPGGDLLVLGTIDTMLNHNLPDEARLRLMRLDKDGNIKWRRLIGRGVQREYPQTLNPTRDGGHIISVRQYLEDPPNPFSIIKIDSMGCDTTEAYCIEQILSGVPEKPQTSRLSIFPNPATNIVTITGNSGHKTRLQILDVFGGEIRQLDSEGSGAYEINVSEFPPGVYLLNSITDTGHRETQKLIINR